MTFPLPASSLIPHRGGMCCIDSILYAEGDRVQSCVRLYDNHFLLDGKGQLDPCGYIELAAQTACALKGATLGTGQDSATALLASVNHLKIYGTACVGDELVIDVNITTELAGVSLLAFSVACEHLLATGQLKVFYQADN